MQGIIITSHDPYYNLALEQTLFDCLHSEEYFLLWQNKPSVIVGRHQNTVEEINEDYVKKHNIPVVRRTTGGGAVYHDLGNLNFSFLSAQNNKNLGSFEFYSEQISKALRSLGFNVEMSGRNDLTIEGKKFSGNAKRSSGSKVLQHGTLMLYLDVSNLADILTGNPDKYKSKGISSHKSRVANLIEFMPNKKPEELMSDVKNALMFHCASKQIQLPEEIEQKALKLAKEKYETWEWNFGKSPVYEVKLRKRFSWGVFELLANVKHGYIEQCEIFGDFFITSDIENFKNNLIGLAYKKEELIAYFNQEKAYEVFIGANQTDFENFFAENLI